MSRKVIPIRNYLMTNCSRKYLAYRTKTQYVDAAMLRKTIISAALATGFSSVCAPSAMADGGALNIRLAVAPIIQLYVTDNVLEMAADDITAEILDSTGLGRSEGRAEFFVAANTGYNIYLSPEETWARLARPKLSLSVKATAAIISRANSFWTRICLQMHGLVGTQISWVGTQPLG